MMTQSAPAALIANRFTPRQRRLVFAVLFESFGLVVTTITLLLLGETETETAGLTALCTMTIALCYSYLFNWGFEAWEARQSVKGRSAKRRITHGVLFQGGLVAILIPFMAWWLDLTLWQALAYQTGLVGVFMVYTMVFTAGFDRVFGLPASAQ